MFKYFKVFERFGIELLKGIFFYGLLGIGKIFFVKVVVNESEVNFIVIKGLEVFSKWVGESEKNICEIFRKVC